MRVCRIGEVVNLGFFVFGTFVGGERGSVRERERLFVSGRGAFFR